MIESDFLKNFIISKYNGQYGKQFNTYEAFIKSVPPVNNYDCAYEISTARLDDHVRIRVNFKITDRDFISTLRNEIAYPTATEQTDDEILVGFGELNSSHSYYEGYKFGPVDTTPDNYLVEETGNPFVCEDGSVLQFEV